MRIGNWEINIKNFITTFITVRWDGWKPRIITLEKYENLFRWITRIFVLIGIVSSVISMEWYYALLTSIILASFDWFIERTIFKWSSVYITPIPNFTYDKFQWKMMGFILAYDEEKDKDIVVCVYKDIEFAEKMFDYFKELNYNQDEDKDNNICLSFIIENYSQYTVHIYPNPERKTTDEFFKNIEQINLLEKYGKEHQQLLFYIHFCNIFPYGVNSQLKHFRNSNKDKPFIFTTGIVDDKGIVVVSKDSIIKHHCKIKERRDILKGELEYNKPKELFD